MPRISGAKSAKFKRCVRAVKNGCPEFGRKGAALLCSTGAKKSLEMRNQANYCVRAARKKRH